MARVEISIGARFGRLTVLRVIPGKRISPKRSCLCRCDCGKETVVRTQHLLSGDTQSCRCLHRDFHSMRAEAVPIGARFGRLTVLAVIPGKRNSSNRSCLCRCDCGKETKVQVSALLSGTTQSCRCLSRDVTVLRNTTHGASKSPEYIAFYNARARCAAGYFRWADYGGRRIKFLFQSFPQFLATVGLRPGPQYSLDRFPNNDGNYEPGNVRWAREQQAANARHGKRPTFPSGYQKTIGPKRKGGPKGPWKWKNAV